MIHCSALKSACSTCSSVGKIAGMLEISNPNIRQARHTADRTTAPRRLSSVDMIRPFVVASQRHTARCCQGTGSSVGWIDSRFIEAVAAGIGLPQRFTAQASHGLNMLEL